MDRHTELCKDSLETILSSKRSLVPTKEKFDATVAHLVNSRDPVDAHFKHWVKTKEFDIVDIPALKLVDMMRLLSEIQLHQGATRHLRVVHADQLYDVTKHCIQVHVDWRAHLEMVALSADRHLVLCHLKIALIGKWRLADIPTNPKICHCLNSIDSESAACIE